MGESTQQRTSGSGCDVPQRVGLGRLLKNLFHVAASGKLFLAFSPDPWRKGPRTTLGQRIATTNRSESLKIMNVAGALRDVARAPSRGEGRARPGRTPGPDPWLASRRTIFRSRAEEYPEIGPYQQLFRPLRGSGACRRFLAGLVLAFLLVIIHTGAGQSQVDGGQVFRSGPFYVDMSDPETIHLDTFITRRAHSHFLNAVEASGQARRVVLSSEGGAVHAALAVAREIDRLDLDTSVPGGARCFSACAFIFLAGKTREAIGALGVHQINSSNHNFESGQIAVASIIEVLSEFDVATDVLVRMFRTPHSDIHVFSESELRGLGLNRKADAVRASLALDGLRQSRDPSLASRALDFVARNKRLWSQPNGRALQDIEPAYALSLQFHGAIRTRSEVMEKKRQFAARWPIRSYDLVKNTAAASCEADRCRVKVEVEWTAQDPGSEAATSGRSHVEFLLIRSEGGFLILSEHEKVLAGQ